MIPKVGDKVRFMKTGISSIPQGTGGVIRSVSETMFVAEYNGHDWYHGNAYEGTNWELISSEGNLYQTDVPYAFDLVPAKALLKVASIFKEGAKKYGKDSWRKHVSLGDNINHSIGHQYMHLSGDATEEHLANAACRSLMALELYLELNNAETP